MKNVGAIKLIKKGYEAKNWRLGAPVSQKRKGLGKNGFHFWNQRGRFSLKRLYEQKRGKKNFAEYNPLCIYILGGPLGPPKPPCEPYSFPSDQYWSSVPILQNDTKI